MSCIFLDPLEGQSCPNKDIVTSKENLTEVAQETTKERLNLHVSSIVR